MVGGPACTLARAGEGQAAADASLLCFKPLVVYDPLAGGEAFRLLIPAGWRGVGQVDWRFHPQYPAGLRVKAFSPTGVEAVYGYPMLPFVAGVWHLPPGGRYIGNEVQPYPGDITGYLRHVLLPRFRPEIRNYRVVAVEPLPALAQSSLAAQARTIGVPARVDAGRVRIAYVENGQPIEEEFYIILDNLPMAGVQFWGAEWATSVRAAPGQLDPVRRIHQVMVSSLRLNLAWYNEERQVASICEQMIRQEQAAIMDRSRILAQANKQISNVIRSSYERRQATMDRVHARFSEYIRGVQSYRAPDGHPIELPSGYSNAWVNNRGEYVLSNNANFNPNVQLQGNWQLLQPVR